MRNLNESEAIPKYLIKLCIAKSLPVHDNKKILKNKINYQREDNVFRKIRVIIPLLLLFFSSLLFCTDEPLGEQVANYTMDIRLDTENNMIRGKEVLSWTNTTEWAVDDLWFHLYWNAFQNNKSTFLTEAGSWARSIHDFEEDDWGYCRLESIRIVENPFFTESDLTPSLEFQNPDDDNIFDQTVFSVKLPQPVQPDQTILVVIDFQSKIPKPVSRTGVWKDYYFFAQWYPKIGVFEDGRWNCHQYHFESEYYADFGTYDVRLTVPSSYIVGATGDHREKTENRDGTATHRYYQHSVHDFAWTASPRFLKYTDTFAFSPGRRTEITLLLQPQHKNLKERYLEAIKHAIRYCSQLYGDYPYPTVTCVDPAFNSQSGGMEYPTFFTGGAYFLTRKGIPSPEDVTIHEFGHGYFYGLIATNEFEYPWMDEGFTSFLDTEIYYKAYGEPLYSKFYFGIPVTFKSVKIPIEAEGISDHRLTSSMDIMQRFAWNFLGGDSYSGNSYAKGHLMLRTLKRFMGEELFNRMMKAYSQRFWFKHPRPQDFYGVVSEFAGQDMSWFLDQFIYGSGKLDYAIGGLTSREPKTPRGWFDGRYESGIKNEEQGRTYESEVVVRRLGEVKMPVEVLVIFEDGEEVRKTWDGQYRWKKFLFTHPSRIKMAIVDPDFKLVLDQNRTNNSMISKADRIAPLKWMSNWMIWLQHALELFTIFGG